MTKPIGYYVSDSEDTMNIATIATLYGSRLEKLDRPQKFQLLSEIIELLEDELAPLPEGMRDELEVLQDDTLLGLLSATVEQLRHGK